MQIRTKIVSYHTADSKPVKQEVNCTVILPPLVFPGQTMVSQSVRKREREREKEREREREREGLIDLLATRVTFWRLLSFVDRSSQI